MAGQNKKKNKTHFNKKKGPTHNRRQAIKIINWKARSIKAIISELKNIITKTDDPQVTASKRQNSKKNKAKSKCQIIKRYTDNVYQRKVAQD